MVPSGATAIAPVKSIPDDAIEGVCLPSSTNRPLVEAVVE